MKVYTWSELLSTVSSDYDRAKTGTRDKRPASDATSDCGILLNWWGSGLAPLPVLGAAQPAPTDPGSRR